MYEYAARRLLVACGGESRAQVVTVATLVAGELGASPSLARALSLVQGAARALSMHSDTEPTELLAAVIASWAALSGMLTDDIPEAVIADMCCSYAALCDYVPPHIARDELERSGRFAKSLLRHLYVSEGLGNMCPPDLA